MKYQIIKYNLISYLIDTIIYLGQVGDNKTDISFNFMIKSNLQVATKQLV